MFDLAASQEAHDDMIAERFAPPATQDEAHREWHLNSGNPIGRTSCPWDACDPDPDARR